MTNEADILFSLLIFGKYFRIQKKPTCQRNQK